MIHRLENTPVRQLIQALEQDGFQYKKRKGSQRVYRHPDNRRVVIHYHHAKDTLPPWYPPEFSPSNTMGL